MSVLLALPETLAGLSGHIVGLIGAVPNPAPVDPTSGSNGTNLLLGYAKWAALLGCGLSGLASGGLMAVGSLSNRPDHVDKGKRAAGWTLVGVIVTAIAIPTVNTVFGAAA